MSDNASFSRAFAQFTRNPPFAWQRRLYEHFLKGDLPRALDLPTGLGKTSVMLLWLLARANGAALPRRLVYVVDRRAIVDQATAEAELLQWALGGDVPDTIKERFQDRAPVPYDTKTTLRAGLGLEGNAVLPVSTLRGQHADNRDWLTDPAAPAIIVGTIDMIGSRLLFEGYGVSRRMRPYMAGLLGMDTLVVLDEAHLVPPFEALLSAIADGRDPETHDAIDLHTEKVQTLPQVAPLKLMTLSATGGGTGESVFTLEKEDWQDQEVCKRLKASKTLTVETLQPADKPDEVLAEALASRAWAQGGEGTRLVIFCHKRTVAQKVESLLRYYGKENDIDIQTELLVGARRVFERARVANWLRETGFTGHDETKAPTYLVATSAGEVGVDMDAHHMVCDLVTWERMVQRLGRLNRRGEGDASITVLTAPAEMKGKDSKAHDATMKDLCAPLAALPEKGHGVDASPGAIVRLKERARSDDALGKALAAATTDKPLRPPLNRPLVDAWSMTSLKEHPGRPEPGPWLRGWVDEDRPQTAVIWRRFLPVQRHCERPDKTAVDAFFEAARPQLIERLETETPGVLEMLIKRSKAIVKNAGNRKERHEADESDRKGGKESNSLEPDDICVIVLNMAGEFDTASEPLTAQYFAQEAGKRKQSLLRSLSNKIVVIDSRLGGLSESGLIDASEGAPVRTYDDYSPCRQGDAGLSGFAFKVELRKKDEEKKVETKPGWSLAYRYPVKVTEEGDAKEFLDVFVARGRNGARPGDPALASRAQTLEEHRMWAEEQAVHLARRLDLDRDLREALAAAARLHDEGKTCNLWQTAMKAPRDDKRPYAKTQGSGRPRLLDGYRHEFGSLNRTAQDPQFSALTPDQQDLVLHLIAAHHGYARPVIAAVDPDFPSDSPALQKRARDVALRFVRLQTEWGPWGLAWLEALLRASDGAASKKNDVRDEVENASGESADG